MTEVGTLINQTSNNANIPRKDDLWLVASSSTGEYNQNVWSPSAIWATGIVDDYEKQLNALTVQRYASCDLLDTSVLIQIGTRTITALQFTVQERPSCHKTCSPTTSRMLALSLSLLSTSAPHRSRRLTASHSSCLRRTLRHVVASWAFLTPSRAPFGGWIGPCS